MFEEDETINDRELEDNPDDYLYVTYPYDYVKINTSTKYFINIPNSTDSGLKPIMDACGFGDLEVVISEFLHMNLD